jgi:hypothetical protein
MSFLHKANLFKGHLMENFYLCIRFHLSRDKTGFTNLEKEERGHKTPEHKNGSAYCNKLGACPLSTKCTFLKVTLQKISIFV